MRIWLPDDSTTIRFDVDSSDRAEHMAYKETFTMTLKPIKAPQGFAKNEEEAANE